MAKPVLDFALLAPTISEAEFQAAVIAKAKRAGGLVYHTHRSDRSEKGFPDLVIATPAGLVLFAELKRQGKQPTPEQWTWLTTLHRCDRVVADWFEPSDMPEIERLLT